ncbi:MAG TPA: peptide chain release factor N(5)-glutamine methyltransferase [Abditibacteriaceae bacterium]|nr:peptide chain release factor N(5)-glutamine methyltransferase [Abditibacteriaceae bacterium]
MTTREIYDNGVDCLAQQGVDAAEAKTRVRLLLDQVTGVRYAHLMQPDAVLDEAAAHRVLNALHAVAQGCPIPYITRQCEFYGLAFLCDKRALIPRPETEVLVEAAVARLKDHPRPTIADLGTGSGCIAVSIAHALPRATISATDVQADALQLAHENAVRHGVADRVKLIEGSTQSWIEPLRREASERQFDAMLSNPPYIATAAIANLQPEIRDWEPRSALDGGSDGLDCYRPIAAYCGSSLRDDGFLMVELGAGQFAAVENIFHSAGWLVEPPLLDLAGIARVLVARLR